MSDAWLDLKGKRSKVRVRRSHSLLAAECYNSATNICVNVTVSENFLHMQCCMCTMYRNVVHICYLFTDHLLTVNAVNI